MPKPIELCVELLDAPEDERFYKCTARTGREKGLSIRQDGAIGWCEPSDTFCDLWVADDERLIAFRPKGAPDVYVGRAGRKILLEETFVATLLNRDLIIINGRTYRIHVHGQTMTVHPPRLLQVVRAAGIAATLSMGVLTLQCGKDTTADSNDASSTATDSDTETETIVIDTNSDSDSEFDAGPDSGQIEVDASPPL